MPPVAISRHWEASMSAAVKVTRMDHTAATLRGLAAKSNDAAQVRRLLALALILEGHTRREAAEQAGMDRQTLRDWVLRYNADGAAGLRSIRIGGHPASRWCRNRPMVDHYQASLA